VGVGGVLGEVGMMILMKMSRDMDCLYSHSCY